MPERELPCEHILQSASLASTKEDSGLFFRDNCDNIPLVSPPLTKREYSSPQRQENVVKGQYSGKTLSIDTTPISAPLRLTGGGDSSFDSFDHQTGDINTGIGLIVNVTEVSTPLKPTEVCQENEFDHHRSIMDSNCLNDVES